MNDWQPSTLDELLEGLTVNDEVERALDAWNDVCLWRTEPIGDPCDEIEEWLLTNGVESKRVREPWTNPTSQSAAERVGAAYSIVQDLEREYESTRLIVATWQPENTKRLPNSLDEYISRLSLLEAQIHRQAEVTCAIAHNASELMSEQLAEAFNA